MFIHAISSDFESISTSILLLSTFHQKLPIHIPMDSEYLPAFFSDTLCVTPFALHCIIQLIYLEVTMKFISTVYSVTAVPFYDIVPYIFRSQHIYLPAPHNTSLSSFELHEQDKLRCRLRSQYTCFCLFLLFYDFSFFLQ